MIAPIFARSSIPWITPLLILLSRAKLMISSFLRHGSSENGKSRTVRFLLQLSSFACCYWSPLSLDTFTASEAGLAFGGKYSVKISAVFSFLGRKITLIFMECNTPFSLEKKWHLEAPSLAEAPCGMVLQQFLLIKIQPTRTLPIFQPRILIL